MDRRSRWARPPSAVLGAPANATNRARLRYVPANPVSSAAAAAASQRHRQQQFGTDGDTAVAVMAPSRGRQRRKLSINCKQRVNSIEGFGGPTE